MRDLKENGHFQIKDRQEQKIKPVVNYESMLI
jgi:hypothetical protein